MFVCFLSIKLWGAGGGIEKEGKNKGGGGVVVVGKRRNNPVAGALASHV